ncbi:bifunctional metallophosphatase/5'-nucleotidase [Halorubrum tebenquichense]|uniref:2',3'-cyclic-nucleotide 2'-phosphodiesterase n=1 Tax=Halorubrum tebenquichense DSM 14210 TaxID=1227485 RepID=M0DVE0_9EURY|nr:5'-nucleotidase C-terminal domain-containing protein [Halorubrum tebenquichense]ELZ38672.1 2',3'-cyclic-nucleotide 2'-phosphodiesterase [Halorubrum tebenquichense DSM 14210]
MTDNNRWYSRRRTLKAIGTGGLAVSLAGCNGTDDGSADGGEEGTDGDGGEPSGDDSASAASGTVTIVHDTHLQGRYGSLDEPANVASYVGLMDRLGEEYPDALRVGVGDDLASSVLSSVFDGEHIVDALNAAGLDYDGFGNHDFDMGPDTFRDQVARSEFPWLCANCLDDRTGEVFAGEEGAMRYALTEVDGVTVGLTGILTEEAPNVASMGEHAEVTDPAGALREVVPRMREEGAAAVVVLSDVASPVVESEVAPAVDGVDAYVGDHAARTYETPNVVNGSLVSAIGDEFEHLAELHLEVEDGEVTGHEFTRHATAEAVGRGLEPNDEVVGLVEEYRSRLDDAVGEEIGRTETTLDCREAVVRREESNMGNFIADAMRDDTGADVAVQNGGSIRTDTRYEPGALTRRDVVNVLPFGNEVTVLEVSGETLRAVLENGVSEVERLSGRFPQVSGIRYAYDPTNDRGERIVDATLDGEPIATEETYTMATNDFIADGGDEYEMLTDVPRALTPGNGPVLSSLIARRIEANSPVAPEVTGRVTVRNPPWEPLVGASSALVGRL